jgi:uncharacterized protein
VTEPSTSPREVVERFLRATAESAWDDLADLYAPDSVIEMPFGPEPGVTTRFEGREGHRARFKAFAPLRQFHKVDSVVILETDDPEVIVLEFDYHATVVATGRPFVNRYVMLVRIRDGQILSSRDYANPLVSAEAFGRLPDLFATLTDRQTRQ